MPSLIGKILNQTPIPYVSRGLTLPWSKPDGATAQMKAYGSVGTLFNIVSTTSQAVAEVDWKLGGRAGAWGDAWRIHQAFPWFGTGLNTYGSATLLLQEFEKATAHYVEAHNDYLQLLVEGGWLVTVPALLLTTTRNVAPLSPSVAAGVA